MRAKPAWAKFLGLFNWLFALVLLVEKGLYLVRDMLWNYPDLLFFGRESLVHKSKQVYSVLRPQSHFMLAGVLMLATLIIGVSFVKNQAFAATQGILIEGVIMGVDDNGRVQKLAKVNPLVPSTIQLEKDLSGLIYEPLFRFEQDGSLTPVLAQNILRIEEGSRYGFDMRADVKWHDGQKFTVDDVIATLDLVNSLDVNKFDSSYVQAVKQMAWERSGPSSLLICTLPPTSKEQWEKGEIDNPCSSAISQRPILSNFLELISIKIMPAYWLKEVNTLNIGEPGPRINQYPIGTGKFKFSSSNGEIINLVRNDEYYGDKAKINGIRFRLFANEEDAVRALGNGELHSVATFSTLSLRDVKNYPQLETSESEVLSNQYWALYFNLRLTPDNLPLGPAFFQDPKVRKAIALGIDKKRVLDTLQGVGAVANSPIPESSEFYNSSANWATYNPQEANRILDEDGWVKDDTGVRVKDGRQLSFKLSYAGSYDRQKTVETIKQDLAQIGIQVIADEPSSRTLIDEVVLGKQFEVLLYGMHTFIDPDRYELFHSSQKTGLNLSGYTGTAETVQIKDGKSVRVPKVDRLLEIGRSLNPLAAKDARKQNYFEFQELLAEDNPVIILYRPRFLYYHNSRLQNVNLHEASSLEERFLSIADWEIR